MKRYVFGLFFSIIVMLFSTPAVAGKTVIGWIEEVAIGKTGFSVHAKIDTGADNSSLSDGDAGYYMKDGRQWVRFIARNRNGDELPINAPVVKWTRIKTKAGGAQKRPVIELDICIGHISRRVRVNLVDRGHLNYGMLIGRSVLRDVFLVDAGQKFLQQQPACNGVN